MSILANSNAIESGGYNIDRSLRFRSSASAYLSKIYAANGNRQKWTFSAWVKRGLMPNDTSQYTMLSSGGSGGDAIMFSDGNKFTVNIGLLGINAGVIPTQVQRDPAAWYHFVVAIDTTQATAANRVLMYVNGVQITSFSTTNYPSQNQNTTINSTADAQAIGRQNAYGNYFDGYLAEVNFIDGQALTPSSFGEFSTVTGVWQPKKYTGTYGTNGFYLDFKDNTSATTLAYDKSGNGNNWTPNNISTTAGTTYDSMTDVPTLTSATAANFAVLNPLTPIGATLSYGNLRVNGGDTDRNSTILMSSGKWYCEVTVTTVGAISVCGVSYGNPIANNYQTNTSYGYGYFSTGNKATNSTLTSYGATYTSGDIIGIAYDADAGSLTFYKNGTSQGVAYSGMPTSSPYAFFVYGRTSTTPNDCSINFGQRPFSYTPPTGFKALNTFNLPDPTIKKPNQYMDATTYTGNGGTQSITNAGAFQPDLVWVKTRVVASSNALFDSVRGVTKALVSNGTAAENNLSAFGVTAFNSNGFTVVDDSAGDYYSNGGSGGTYSGTPPNYVGWQWKKGATPGFDIVTYTGTETNRTVNHSLGVAPKMLICKVRDYAPEGWFVWHSALSGTEFLQLNTTDAKGTATNLWNSAIPTSSSFSLGTGASANRNGKNFVAYLFAEIPGFSKFGSYTGNGSTDGPNITCGFQPRFIMFKRTDSGADWHMYDTARDTYNVVEKELNPSTSIAETTAGGPRFDYTANGFKVRTTGAALNASGGTYIYAAFAAYPFKYSNAR